MINIAYIEDITRREFFGLLKKAAIKGAAGSSIYFLLNPLARELYTSLNGAAYMESTPKNEYDLNQVQAELARITKQQHSEDTKKIDYLGSANFVAGMASLLKNNHIHWLHYTAAIASFFAKYLISDEAGKHHLKMQFGEICDAMRIILGTTIIGEGIKLNLDAAIQNTYQRNATKEEKIFAATTIPMGTGLFTKTVGSAAIFRQPISDLVNSIINDGENQGMNEKIKREVYANMIAHIANNTGFLLIGDPPFIAMLQKYGIEGFKFQNYTMEPLMLYSAARTALKMSKFTNEHHRASLENAVALLTSKDNWRFFYDIVKESANNAYKCLTLGTQSESGIIMHPLGEMEQKLRNTYKLLRGEYGPHNIHGLEAAREEINILKASAMDSLDGLKSRHYKSPAEALAEAFKHLQKSEWHISLMRKLERAYGPNLTDILTVFTFQGLSLPFIVTVFNDWLDSMKNSSERIKDACVYSSILSFSAFADNYIACKIGLEVYPHKPEIPFIASIIGGSTLPCGNMSNLNLVSLKEHSLWDGVLSLPQHLDMLGAGFGYAEMFPYLEKIPVIGRLYAKTGIMNALKQH